MASIKSKQQVLRGKKTKQEQDKTVSEPGSSSAPAPHKNNNNNNNNNGRTATETGFRGYGGACSNDVVEAGDGESKWWRSWGDSGG